MGRIRCTIQAVPGQPRKHNDSLYIKSRSTHIILENVIVIEQTHHAFVTCRQFHRREAALSAPDHIWKSSGGRANVDVGPILQESTYYAPTPMANSDAEGWLNFSLNGF